MSQQKNKVWATPNTLDHIGLRSEEALKRQFSTTRKGRTSPANLREQVHPECYPERLWPTPTKCGNYNRKGASKTSGDGLSTAVKTWPTQRVFMYKYSKIDRGKSNLGEVVFGRTFQTPTASDCRDRGNPSNNSIKRRVKLGKSIELSMTVEGSLNPEWVEWLMGWPIGWTSLKPLKKLMWLNFSKDPHPDIPKVYNIEENHEGRLKAIGNGQFPKCVAEAWNILKPHKQ